MNWFTRKFIGLSMVVLRPLFALADMITGCFVPGYYKKSKKQYWNTVEQLM